MDNIEIQTVQNAIENCNLTYLVRANRWIVINIPFCTHECVHLLIPIDIASYRLKILLAEC